MGVAWLGIALLGGCIVEGGDEDTAQVSDGLYVATGKIWSSAEIPVCWEDAGNEEEKGWVRDALSKSWEAESNVTFTGFGPCTSATNSGIRIRTADEWPLTWGLGTDLDNAHDGMVLNFWFEFRTWWNGEQPFAGCLGSAREGCIRSLAVHEFGHALGFAHEQNRPDTPGSCTKPAQGSNGDETVGPWDLSSVMNYCNPVYNNGGFLSATDIWGVQQYYGGRKPISAVAPAPDRLNVVARSIDELMMTWTWYGESSFGWAIGTWQNQITDTPTVVAAGPSTVHAFVRGTDGALYTRVFDGTGWGYGFVQLGADPIVGSPVAVSRAPGLVDVFVRGTDGALYTKHFNGTSWSASYVKVAPFGSPAVGFIGTPAVIARASDRIDVIARGKDNRLYHSTWDGTAWSTFAQLAANPVASNPVAVSWAPSRLDVFVRGTDDALYTSSWTGAWSAYAQLGPNPFRGDPAAVSWGPDRIDVFVRGTDNALYTKAWDGTQWTGYTQLASNPILASPSVASWAPGRLDVFVRGTNNYLYRKSWNGAQWSSYAAIGSAAFH